MDIPAISYQSLAQSGTMRYKGERSPNGSPAGDIFTPSPDFPGVSGPPAPGKNPQLMNMTTESFQNQEDGISAGKAAKVLLREAPNNPHKLWECKVDGSLNAPPAVDSDGIAYVGSVDHHLRAIKDGKEIWSFKAGDRISYCTYALESPDTKYSSSI